MNSSRLPRLVRGLFPVAFMCWAIPGLAGTPDDTYLRCASYLVAVETSIIQRLDNYFNDGSDKVSIGFVELESGKAARYPGDDLEGFVYTGEIQFQYIETYTLDRVHLTLSRNRRSDEEFPFPEIEPDSERIDFRCSMVSKSEMHAIVDRHNHALGGVKF